MSTYYRIQEADRDVTDLLDPEQQVSYCWGDESEDRTRRGVSVCESLEDLAAYLAQAGIPFGCGEWVIVELDGTTSPDRPLDAHIGEILLLPHTIVSVSPMGDDFFDMIGSAYDALEGQ